MLRWMRIDQLPHPVDDLGVLTSLGGLGVMVLRSRSSRIVVVKRIADPGLPSLGIAFHLSVWVFTGINFWTLLVCYTVFVDTSWFSRATPQDRVTQRESGEEKRPSRIALFRAETRSSAPHSSPVLCSSTRGPWRCIRRSPAVAEPRAWTLTFEAVSPNGTVDRETGRGVRVHYGPGLETHAFRASCHRRSGPRKTQVRRIKAERAFFVWRRVTSRPFVNAEIVRVVS